MNTSKYQHLKDFVESTNDEEQPTVINPMRTNHNCETSFRRAVAEIYITMVGTGVFALPTSMLPVGIGAGMIFVVITSILSLFTNYGLLYAMKHKEAIIEDGSCGSCCKTSKSSKDMTREPLLSDSDDNKRKKEPDPYFEVIEKFLNFPFAMSLFSIVYWILILICCVANFVVLKSYLISIFDAKDTTALQADSAGLWILVVAILAIPWSILKANAKVEVFDRIGRVSSIFAAMVTTVAVLGTIIVFIVQWSHQGCPLRNFEPQPIPEKYLPVSKWYLILMYLGAVIPNLCMTFLNHMTMPNIVKNLSMHDSGKIAKSRQFEAVWVAQLVATILYAAVPFFALLARGNAVGSNVLLTMTSRDGGDTSSVYIIVGKILQACSGLGVLGVLFNIYLPTLVKCTFKLPLISLCERLRDKKSPCWGISMMAIVESLVVCVGSIGCYLVAILSNAGLDLFMGLGGSLSASAIMFVFPGIVFARIVLERTKSHASPGRKFWGYSMVFFAWITVFAGIIFTVLGIFWIYKVGLIVPNEVSNSTSSSNSTIMVVHT